MSNSILSLIGNTPLVSLNRILGEGMAAILGKAGELQSHGQHKGPHRTGHDRGCRGVGKAPAGIHPGGAHQRQCRVALAMVAAAKATP